MCMHIPRYGSQQIVPAGTPTKVLDRIWTSDTNCEKTTSSVYRSKYYRFTLKLGVSRPLHSVAPRWRSPMWSAQAAAEGLTLRVADNTTGFFGVYLSYPGKPKPYLARVRRGDKTVGLGSFATAEEAALCVARSPEGQEAAQRAAAAPTLTSKEARQQAQAEKLTLRVADNRTGFLCGRPRPYLAQVSRSGRMMSLSCFATTEEAALCVARSPEGQAAAEWAAAAPPLLASDFGCGDDTGEEGEEEVEVLDAVEVHDDDDDDDESLLLEAEGLVGRKRARESTRLGDEDGVSR